MNAYRDALSNAVERTKKWGLLSRGTIALESYLQFSDGERPGTNVPALVDLSRRLPHPPLMRAGACAQVHVAALAMLYQDDLFIPPVLTVGNVLVEGKPRYQVSRQGLRQLLRVGRKGTGVFHAHMWLTWADLTIFDLSLLPSILHEDGEELDLDRPDGLALIGKAEELEPSLTYVPYLVGQEFVWRIGAMPEGVEAHFRQTEEVWQRRLGRFVGR